MSSRGVYLSSGDAFAFGHLTEVGTIVVHEGARVRFDETPTTPPWTRDLRRKLITEGIWVPVGKACYRQVRDYAYNTLSSAACALTGSSVNGHQAWRFLDNDEPVG